jgi:HD-GYP domain-containing protein (c-di-GMP phosphodiesterase class II)
VGTGLDLVIASEASLPIRSVAESDRADIVVAQLGRVGGHDVRLDLLFEVGKKASSASEVSRVVDEIVPMTKHALRASASSLLLLDEERQELFFEFADGDAEQTLKPIRISVQSGIAGWVARHREPIIVNDAANDERFCKDIDRSTGFLTRSIMCAPLMANGRLVGVIEVLNKLDGSDFDGKDLETLMAVASTAAISLENARLHEAVMDGYRRTVKALAAAIDAKDPYTCGHSQRVKEYALLAGRFLVMAREELKAVEYAGILHDVGKIGIVDSTLRKPCQLAPDEWVIMRSHPSIGANIIGDAPFLGKARELVLHHHEKYDGTGYPSQLRREAIPLGARLIAVADAFDTMTTDRAYRSAFSVDYALNELRKCVGTQFCPLAVEAFSAAFRDPACLAHLTIS